jgi:hypothetical protein
MPTETSPMTELTTYAVRCPGDPHETDGGVEYTTETELEARQAYLTDFWSGEWLDGEDGEAPRFISQFPGDLNDDLEVMVVIEGAGA